MAIVHSQILGLEPRSQPDLNKEKTADFDAIYSIYFYTQPRHSQHHEHDLVNVHLREHLQDMRFLYVFVIIVVNL